MTKPVLAITMGDPAGVGPEIIVKALQQSAILEKASLVIIATDAIIQQQIRHQGLTNSIHKITDIQRHNLEKNTLSLIDPTEPTTAACTQGIPSVSGGKAAASCIVQAVKLVDEKKANAIVTAPISKEALHKAGFFYPGHTEFLAELTHTKHFAMMLAGGGLRVVPVTTHMALSDVPAALTTSKIISNIQVLHDWLTRFVTPHPRIAVCALNPHAGDGGIFGNEEKEIIEPAIDAVEKKGIQAEGPYPADALFAKVKKERYDAVVAMYHDQALIPLKMAAFGNAVNITIGLPLIRTSVDHGTAYDIAGKNLADPTSLINAINVAADLALIN